MSQLTVYRNKAADSKDEIPYLLDIQNDLLSDLNTRVVVPLYRKKSAPLKLMTKLTPEFEIEGKKLVLMTPQLAGVTLKNLGDPAGDLRPHRSEIIAALDLLITGF